MEDGLQLLRSRRVGLALSGGAVRGLAHIGVIKVLAEHGIRPAVVAGVSAGSLVGAALAAGMEWREIAALARSVFWPGLLHGGRLERFCARHLPEAFAQLRLPFAAVATAVPSRQAVVITEGQLASAVSASCAIPFLRRPVRRGGQRLVDGGVACIIPSGACRDLGAEFVIASDVWELSSLLRAIGCDPASPRGGRLYPAHYRQAVGHADLLIEPSIPAAGYVPSAAAVERLIGVGEQAAHRALARWAKGAGTTAADLVASPK